MNLDYYLAVGYYGSIIIKTKVCLIVLRICLLGCRFIPFYLFSSKSDPNYLYIILEFVLNNTVETV